MKKQVVVIGLGRFGSSVCKELYALGHEVLAIDQDIEKVDAVNDFSSQASVANATDEKDLKSLGVRNFQHAIIAIGDDLQSSVLCTLMVKDLGVEKVWVKARDVQHQKILEKVGADRVIQPENEMGIRVAHHVDSEKIVDYIELSKDFSIVELTATKKVANRTLDELSIRTNYDCVVLAIKQNEDVNIAPVNEDVVKQGDVLIVMGHREDLKRFEDKGL